MFSCYLGEEKRFAPGVTGTDVWNRLAFVPALSHSFRFMTPFLEGELGKFRRDHVPCHCFPLEVLLNCSFSFIFCPLLRFAHGTSLRPRASQPRSWGKATHEMTMSHRTSRWEPVLLIRHSILLTPTSHRRTWNVCEEIPVIGLNPPPWREQGTCVAGKVRAHVHSEGN